MSSIFWIASYNGESPGQVHCRLFAFPMLVIMFLILVRPISLFLFLFCISDACEHFFQEGIVVSLIFCFVSTIVNPGQAHRRFLAFIISFLLRIYNGESPVSTRAR
jgi:hypothetical protein